MKITPLHIYTATLVVTIGTLWHTEAFALMSAPVLSEKVITFVSLLIR